MSFGSTFADEAAEGVEHDEDTPPALHDDELGRIERLVATDPDTAERMLTECLRRLSTDQLVADEFMWRRVDKLVERFPVGNAERLTSAWSRGWMPPVSPPLSVEARVRAHAANQARSAAQSVDPAAARELFITETAVDAAKMIAARVLDRIARHLLDIADRLNPRPL